ncbi:MAG: hypothetical protein ABFS35_13925 [Bacteroidota bacterium]
MTSKQIFEKGLQYHHYLNIGQKEEYNILKSNGIAFDHAKILLLALNSVCL